MTGPEQRPSGDWLSGDYGYDLAHEGAGAPPPRGARPAPECGPPSPDARALHRDENLNYDEDLNYDEAHDF